MPILSGVARFLAENCRHLSSPNTVDRAGRALSHLSRQPQITVLPKFSWLTPTAYCAQERFQTFSHAIIRCIASPWPIFTLNFSYQHSTSTALPRLLSALNTICNITRLHAGNAMNEMRQNTFLYSGQFPVEPKSSLFISSGLQPISPFISVQNFWLPKVAITTHIKILICAQL